VRLQDTATSIAMGSPAPPPAPVPAAGRTRTRNTGRAAWRRRALLTGHRRRRGSELVRHGDSARQLPGCDMSRPHAQLSAWSRPSSRLLTAEGAVRGSVAPAHGQAQVAPERVRARRIRRAWRPPAEQRARHMRLALCRGAGAVAVPCARAGWPPTAEHKVAPHRRDSATSPVARA
jgi:hypothetical protein